MLTLTDMFCGAGGSSTGAISVPGIEVRTAMNHWALAIETHNTNHPTTDHVLADISQTDPRYVRGSDILWASPECTNHSVAKGRKRITAQDELWDATLPDEAAERSRATMWDVPRFAEVHRYRAIITENVVDAAKWVMFPAWLMAMDALGYNHQIVYLNSMHAQSGGMPAPQSRDRMYVVFWRKGDRRPDVESMQRPVAWCPSCDELVAAVQTWKKPDAPWGRYRAQYLYRCPKHSCRGQIVEPAWLPAAAAIDWSLPAERIGDRARPLSAKTIARIREGLKRYGTSHGQLIQRHNTGGAEMLTPAYEVLRTLTTAGHQSLVDPLIVEAAGNTYDAADPRHPQHGQDGAYYRVWPATDPLRTLHGTVSKGIVLDAVRGSTIATDTDQVLATQTTSYTRALLVPAGGTWHDRAHPVSDAMRALTATEAHALLIPVEGRDGKLAGHVMDALRTQTARNETALLVPYYSASEAARPTDEPLGTLTTVDRYALITLRGQNAPKPVREVMDTVAANGNHHAIADVSVPDVEDCRFRMLEPSEIKRGMAFPTDYVMLGNKREQVRMAGNAVTPPAARDLVRCVAEALGSAA